jgi:hypothetical protein
VIHIDSIRPGTVNVLIGPNGSGKSRLLRKLCTDFLRRGDEVIAVAPTIYDRFRKMPKRGLRFYGARQGRDGAIQVVRAALTRASAENPRILRNLTRALEYTHFNPVIGIGLSDLKMENLEAAVEGLNLQTAEELQSALLKWKRRGEGNGIVRLQLDKFSFEELDALTFALLVLHEDRLRRSKTTSRIEYFLYRNNVPIPLLEACSGEICFITTVAFISTQINRRSVIAIDEPDTSLHPTWQQSYVRTLLDLFHHYEPRILISTHSPIIISGAEAANGEVLVYEMNDGEPRIYQHAKLSLEEMYDQLFGLITPKNHHLSQRAVSLLNDLNAGDRNLNEVLGDLEALRTKSYDQSQQSVIATFEDMARRLESMKQERGA